MTRFLLAWTAGSAAAFIAAWAGRSWLKGGVARPWRMHLPGLIVLCLLAGAVTALLYDWLSGRFVPLPPELERTPPLGAPR